MSPIERSAGGGSSGGTQGTEIGYDPITSSVNIVSTTEATGTTVISCAAHTFDGSPVLFHFFTPVAVAGTTAGGFMVVCLFEGATQIGRIGVVETPATNFGVDCAMSSFLRFTPTAASHTYTVTAFIGGSATGQVQAGAGGTGTNVPAFCRFTKV